MSKIGLSYLDNLESYNETSLEVWAQYASSLTELNKMKKIKVPDEFYLRKDNKNICFMNSTNTNTYYNLIFEILMKTPALKTDESFSEIESKKFYKLLTDKKNRYNFLNLSDCNDIDRKFLLRSESISELEELCLCVYKNLTFKERAFENIPKSYRQEIYIEEVVKHLNALDDFCNTIKQEELSNIKELHRKLKSSYGIENSGMGSNEKKTKYYIEELKDYFIPHTKLFNNHSDVRIYFQWPNKEEKSNKIVIGRIGKHN